MRAGLCVLMLSVCLVCVLPALGEVCSYATFNGVEEDHTFYEAQTYPNNGDLLEFWQSDWAGFGGHPYLVKTYVPSTAFAAGEFAALSSTPLSGTFDLKHSSTDDLVSTGVDWNWFVVDSDTAALQYTITNWDAGNFSPTPGLEGTGTLYIDDISGDTQDIIKKWSHASPTSDLVCHMLFYGAIGEIPSESSTTYYCEASFTAPTPTPTFTGYSQIGVNVWEKYSNAILINQAVTVTPTSGGAGVTKTSPYGATLYFDVYPGVTYWFNASRPGFEDYNQTYLIPNPPGVYGVYMERILTPYANKSYAHFSIIDQTNGGLVPNAAILLSDGQSKLSNSAGYAYFLVNNSEQYNYTISKTGYYIPASGTFNISADESILVALQRSTGPTPTWVLPSWTPVTVPTTGSGAIPTLSAQLRQQNIQQGMDVWYTNLPFISQFLFLLFIIGGLGLMAGGGRRN